MPTATMQFSLPDEEHEFNDARQGGELRSSVEDFARWLRDNTKYADPKTRTERVRRRVLYEVIDRLRESVDGLEVTL